MIIGKERRKKKTHDNDRQFCTAFNILPSVCMWFILCTEHITNVSKEGKKPNFDFGKDLWNLNELLYLTHTHGECKCTPFQFQPKKPAF